MVKMYRQVIPTPEQLEDPKYVWMRPTVGMRPEKDLRDALAYYHERLAEELARLATWTNMWAKQEAEIDLMVTWEYRINLLLWILGEVGQNPMRADIIPS